MNVRSLAAVIALALLATAVAPVNAQTVPPAPKAEIVLSASTLVVVEEGAAQPYRVALGLPPAGPVVVNIAPDVATTEITITPGSVTLDAQNWQTGVEVRIAHKLGDNVLEGTHTHTLVHTATATDPSYSGKTASLTVHAADNDFGLVVAHTGASTSVKEDLTLGDHADFVTVSLGSAPGAPVQVTLTPADNTQFTLDRFNIGFNPSNWHTPVTVKASALPDDVSEGNQATAINAKTTGGGAYGGLTLSVPLTIVDDDVVGLRLTDLAGATLAGTPPAINTAAAGETAAASYKAVLRSKPAGTVTVDLSVPSGQATVAPARLTFGPGNWSIGQAATVTGLPDDVDEGSNTRAIALAVVHAIASPADAAYDALPDQGAVFNQLDDDTAGYVLDGGPVNQTLAAGAVVIAEPSSSDSYTLRLNSQPTAPVTVSFTASPSQFTVAPASVTFGAGNWSQARTVTVTAVDDLVAEAQLNTALAQSVATLDPYYATVPASVPVRINDNDVAAIQPTVATGFNVVEGGIAKTFTVRLGSQPTGPVAVAVAAPADLRATPESLSFSTSNWTVAQTVTVSAADDTESEFQETLLVSLTPASGDGNYNGAAKKVDVTVNVLDNDGVLVVEESAGSTVVQEAGANDTYTVRLFAPPSEPVTVTVAAPAGLLVNGAATATLTFNPDVPAELSGVLATVNGALGTVGLGPVDLEGAYGPTEGSPWNQARTITVSAPEDANGAVTGSVSLNVTHTLASDDDAFDGALARNVPAYRMDNDAGILVTETAGSTAVTEGGAPDTYTVRLATAPVEGVAILLEHDAQLTLSDEALYFDAFYWDFPQTVTVAAYEDHADEADTVLSVIAHPVASNDGTYRALTGRSVPVTVTDVDSAGIDLVESGGSTTVTEAGATDSYTLVLQSVPPGTVTISMATPGGQVTLSPSSVTFTTANWNQVRTITVAAVNDNVDETSTAALIRHTVTGWPSVSARDVHVTVVDNDDAGVLVTQTGGSTAVSESGTGDGFNVRLSSQPTADVTVSFGNADGELEFPTASLTFTPANWATTQLGWVRAVNDAQIEGAQASAVTFTVASSDAGYNGRPVAALPVAIADNDAAGVRLVASGGSTTVTEGGSGDGYNVLLDAQPASDVTVSFTNPDGELSFTSPTLTFTPANWNTPQLAWVRAVDDADAEGAHTGIVSVAVASADADFDGLPVADQSVSIVDND